MCRHRNAGNYYFWTNTTKRIKMKIQVLKNYLNLSEGAIVDKDDFIAEKLIRLGIAKSVKELKEIEVPTPLVEETKEFKPKGKKTK